MERSNNAERLINSRWACSALLHLDAARLERFRLRKSNPKHARGQLGVNFRCIDALRNREDTEVVLRSVLRSDGRSRGFIEALCQNSQLPLFELHVDSVVAGARDVSDDQQFIAVS